MANFYPTGRSSGTASNQGGSRTSSGGQSGTGLSSLLSRVLAETADRASRQKALQQRGSLPYGQIGLLQMLNPPAPRPVGDGGPASGRLLRGAAKLDPKLDPAALLRLILLIRQMRQSDGADITAVPGAGFEIVAQCHLGDAGDRLWNESSIPMPLLTRSLINNCTVSTAYFPSSPVSVTTRSYARVHSILRVGFPHNGRAVIGYERPTTGAVNPPGSVRFDGTLDGLNKPKLGVPEMVGIMPSLTPTELPLGMPVAKPNAALVRAWNALVGSSPLITREVGPDVENQVKRHAKRGRVTLPNPKTSPRLDREPPPPEHQYRPPPRRAKEIKLKARGFFAFKKAFGTFTEGHDFVGALHDALPAECRRSRTWQDKKGKWHRKLMSSMLRDLWNCSNQIDIAKAAYNLAANQVEDYVIGRISRQLNNSTGAMFGSTGVQGAGTRLTGGNRGDAAEWNAFAGLSAAKDALASYLGVAKSSGSSSYRKQARRDGRAAAYRKGRF